MSKAKERAARKRAVASKVRAPATNRKLKAKRDLAKDIATLGSITNTTKRRGQSSSSEGRNMKIIGKQIAEQAQELARTFTAPITPKSVVRLREREQRAAAREERLAKINVTLPRLEPGVHLDMAVHVPYNNSMTTFMVAENGHVFVGPTSRASLIHMGREDRARYAQLIGVPFGDVELAVRRERKRMDAELDGMMIEDAIKTLQVAGYEITVPSVKRQLLHRKRSK